MPSCLLPIVRRGDNPEDIQTGLRSVTSVLRRRCTRVVSPQTAVALETRAVALRGPSRAVVMTAAATRPIGDCLSPRDYLLAVEAIAVCVAGSVATC